jgi:hypothetical protein
MTTQMEQNRATLSKIETLLAGVVGVQKVVMVTIPQFMTHVHMEIEKAKTEEITKSRARLSLLYKSVLYSSAAIEDAESDDVRVPVFVADQTALGDQENTLTNFAAAAAKNPKMGTYFEKAEHAAEGDGAGLEALVERFQKQVGGLAALLKVGENEEEGDDAQGKAGGKKPPPGPGGKKEPPKPPVPPGPPGKGAKPEEDEEKRKAAEKALDALPDRAFLLVVEKGADKDGKPQKDRKFPFMKADGSVDIDALKASIDEIGKAEELDEDDKEMLREKVKRILEAQKKIGKGLAKGDAPAWPDDMNDPNFVAKGHMGEADWGLDELPPS